MEAGLLFIYLFIYLLFYVLFIYLYCFLFLIYFGFYMERVFVERCFHIYFSFRESIHLFTYLFGRAVEEFIFGTVAC